jgi:cobalt-zinc-cadmium efflux system outer membrane protein
VACATLILLAAMPVVCHAAEPLNLDQAVSRALAGNPELALAGHRHAAAVGRVTQAGLRPNPSLTLEMENLLGTGTYEGVDLAETTLSVAWVLERGKRSRRVAAAEAGLASVDVEGEIQRLEVAAASTEAFLKVLLDQQRLRQTGEAVRLAEEAVKAVQARVRAGRSPAADLARAEADRAWLALAQEDVQHELLVSRRMLAATWGSLEADFTRAVGDLYALPPVDAFEALLARLEESPWINQYLTEQRLRDAEVALADAESKQSWQVQAGVRYFSLSDDAALVAAISLPLAVSQRNQGRRMEARAQAAMTTERRVATRVRIEATLFRLHEQLVYNVHRFEAIRDDVLPRTRTVLADARRAYEQGRYGYSDLRQAQIRKLEAEAALLREAYDAHVNRTGIERLTGMTVSTTEPEGGRP